jgi:hypothetical protein
MYAFWKVLFFCYLFLMWRPKEQTFAFNQLNYLTNGHSVKCPLILENIFSVHCKMNEKIGILEVIHKICIHTYKWCIYVLTPKGQKSWNGLFGSLRKLLCCQKHLWFSEIFEWNSVLPLREWKKNKNRFGVVEKKLCYLNCFFIISSQFGQLPKNTKNKILNFLLTLNISISTRKVMVYSMFISEVNNMKSFVMWAVMTILGKDNIWWLFFKSILTFFKKLEVGMDYYVLPQHSHHWD